MCIRNDLRATRRAKQFGEKKNLLSYYFRECSRIALGRLLITNCHPREFRIGAELLQNNTSYQTTTFVFLFAFFFSRR